MIRTGVSAIKVEAIPAFACSTAISDSATPALRSSLVRHSKMKIPAKPKIARIKVRAKGIANITDSGVPSGRAGRIWLRDNS